MQDKASLHEKAVQKVAKDNLTMKGRGRGKSARPNTSRVYVSNLLDGVDPILVKWVKKNKIHPSRIKVIGPTEIRIMEEE